MGTRGRRFDPCHPDHHRIPIKDPVERLGLFVSVRKLGFFSTLDLQKAANPTILLTFDTNSLGHRLIRVLALQS